MKLPRWLVIAMLTTSLLAVLAAAGWWWVTWPEMTARRFITLIRESRFEKANEMLCNTHATPRLMEHWRGETFEIEPEFAPRRFEDLLFGRVTFRRETYQRDEFRAERGRIVFVLDN